MQCPICLKHIEADTEAFLDTCLHHFCLQCIHQWNAVQRARHAEAKLLCPVCNRPYTSIVHDCRGLDFSRTFVATQNGGVGAAPALQLTPEHRRRRLVYATPAADVVDVEQSRAPVSLALARRPAVAQWLRRELQALLLEPDVALVEQHLLGTLFHVLKPPSSAGSAACKKRARLSPADVESRLAEVANPYLGDRAARFAAEAVLFVQSGLSVPAHDAAVVAAQDQVGGPSLMAEQGSGSASSGAEGKHQAHQAEGGA